MSKVVINEGSVTRHAFENMFAKTAEKYARDHLDDAIGDYGLREGSRIEYALRTSARADARNGRMRMGYYDSHSKTHITIGDHATGNLGKDNVLEGVHARSKTSHWLGKLWYLRILEE